MRHKSWRVDEIKQQTMYKKWCLIPSIVWIPVSPGFPRIWRKDEKVAHNCLLLLHLQLPSLPSQLWLPQLFSISFRHLGMEVKSSEMCFGVQNTPHAATLPFRNNYHQHCRHSLQCFVGGPNPKPVYCIFGIIFTNIKPASWVVLCPKCVDKIIAP